MPTTHQIKPTFSGGELTPKAWGRVDIARFDTSVKKLRNFIIQPQGGVYRRPALQYVNEVKDSSMDCRLLEFEYSTTQAYILEMGDRYLRFYANEAPVAAPAVSPSVNNGTMAGSVAGWTDASTAPGTISYDAAEGGMMKLANGATGAAKATQQINTTDANAEHVIVFRVRRKQQADGGKVIFNVNGLAKPFNCDASGWYAIQFTPGVTPFTISFEMAVLASAEAWIDDVSFMGGTVFELPTHIPEADLWNMTYTQSADVLFMCHQSYKPYKLSRFNGKTWTLTEINFVDGPYLTDNSTTTTIAPSATTGEAITLTASAALFSATDVGRLVRIKHGTVWGYAKITGYTSSTVVTAEVLSAFGATTPQTTWRLGSWSDTTGWPVVCDFYEQRLVFGRTPTEASTLWFSSTGLFYDMTPSKPADGTVLATHGITYSIYSKQVNAINWMSSGSLLIIGTAGGEYVVKKATTTEGLSPTNIEVKKQTRLGSRQQKVVQAGNATLFVQRSGRRIYEMVYDIQEDSYNNNEMTLLSEHLFQQGDYVKDLCFQYSPDGVMWVVTNRGYLQGMTYLREQQIIGWHRHEFHKSTVKARSTVCIPTPDGNSDQVWVLVERKINGVTKKYIEVMDQPFTPFNEQDKNDMCFMDSYLKYDGRQNTTLTLSSAAVGTSVTATAGGASFVVGDVGRHIHVRYQDANDVQRISRAVITGYTSPTVVTVEIKSAMPSTSIEAMGWALTATTLSGYSHLIGETVAVLADGAEKATKVVDGSGQVTLDRPGSIVYVGLNYTSILYTLPPDGQTPVGTMQGKKGRIMKSQIRVDSALTLKYGTDIDELTTLAFRDSTDPMDSSPPLFTGDLDFMVDCKWERNVGLFLVQDKPYPLTILALMPEIIVNP